MVPIGKLDFPSYWSLLWGITFLLFGCTRETFGVVTNLESRVICHSNSSNKVEMDLDIFTSRHTINWHAMIFLVIDQFTQLHQSFQCDILFHCDLWEAFSWSSGESRHYLYSLTEWNSNCLSVIHKMALWNSRVTMVIILIFSYQGVHNAFQFIAAFSHHVYPRLSTLTITLLITIIWRHNCNIFLRIYGLQLCQEGHAEANDFGGQLSFGIGSVEIDADEILF